MNENFKLTLRRLWEIRDRCLVSEIKGEVNFIGKKEDVSYVINTRIPTNLPYLHVGTLRAEKFSQLLLLNKWLRLLTCTSLSLVSAFNNSLFIPKKRSYLEVTLMRSD